MHVAGGVPVFEVVAALLVGAAQAVAGFGEDGVAYLLLLVGVHAVGFNGELLGLVGVLRTFVLGVLIAVGALVVVGAGLLTVGGVAVYTGEYRVELTCRVFPLGVLVRVRTNLHHLCGFTETLGFPAGVVEQAGGLPWLGPLGPP